MFTHKLLQVELQGMNIEGLPNTYDYIEQPEQAQPKLDVRESLKVSSSTIKSDSASKTDDWVYPELERGDPWAYLWLER